VFLTDNVNDLQENGYALLQPSCAKYVKRHFIISTQIKLHHTSSKSRLALAQAGHNITSENLSQ
jgi:hypothetical protein